VPGTRRLVFPSCGHSPHREQPKTLIAAIAQFAEVIEGAER
jgi:pimeloyl-ACP methyl ester carboxylesterase